MIAATASKVGEGRWWNLVALLGVALCAAMAGQFLAPSLAGRLPQAMGLELSVAALSCAGFLVVVLWPELGVLALVPLVYTNASEIAVRHLAVPSPLQGLALALAIGLGLRLSEGKGNRAGFVMDPLLLPLGLYLAVVFASSLVASDRALADERLVDHLKGLLIFLVLTNGIRSRATLKRSIWAMILAGAFLGSISLFQVLTQSYDSDFFGFGRIKVAQIVGEVREPRIAGPLSDPNFYAQILVALVPLALVRVWDERQWKLKLVAAYALGVTTFAAVFTYSRGGAAALCLVLLLSLLIRKIRLRHIVASLLVLAPVSLAVPTDYAGRLVTLLQVMPGTDAQGAGRQDGSFRQRRLLTTVGWEMFVDRPVLGVGAGNYTDHFTEYGSRVGTTLRSYEKFGGPFFPHNTFIEVLAETGIAGFLAFAATLLMSFAALTGAYRGFRLKGWRAEANIAISIALALTAYLATSLLLHAHYVQYFWLLIALAAAARQVAGRAPAREAAHYGD